MRHSTNAVVLFALAAFVSSLPLLVKRDVDPTLVPQFGVQAGTNPTGTGDCDGITNAQGQVVKIPCSCPPDRNSFIQSLSANVAAGHVLNNPSVPVTFPADSSAQSQIARLQTAIVTLQNLHGPGVGCPAASATFLRQQQALTVAAAQPLARQPSQVPLVNPALVPEFGVQAGQNPDGTGNCDGIKNAQGKIVEIPCSCPPDRNAFIQSLGKNVAQGRVVNNPGVAVTFPTDDSTASKIARIQAALVTLQNLKGPGVGCPAASTTFLQRLLQLQALQG
ncbi:hypothetical protein APHAL10511_002659 [Amanita phalloides]|nr:hypothetical protein APHAL10511_002659 [Amanita phalloides]